MRRKESDGYSSTALLCAQGAAGGLEGFLVQDTVRKHFASVDENAPDAEGSLPVRGGLLHLGLVEDGEVGIETGL